MRNLGIILQGTATIILAFTLGFHQSNSDIHIQKYVGNPEEELKYVGNPEEELNRCLARIDLWDYNKLEDRRSIDDRAGLFRWLEMSKLSPQARAVLEKRYEWFKQKYNLESKGGFR